jgi:hypothetical protein
MLSPSVINISSPYNKNLNNTSLINNPILNPSPKPMLVGKLEEYSKVLTNECPGLAGRIEICSTHQLADHSLKVVACVRSNQKEFPVQALTEPLKPNSILSKQEDLKQKSGHIWICKDRIVDPETSKFIYVFEIENEYNHSLNKNANRHYKHKNKEIHPAVELNAKELFFLDPAYYIEHCNLNDPKVQESLGLCRVLNKLGFECLSNHKVVNAIDFPKSYRSQSNSTIDQETFIPKLHEDSFHSFRNDTIFTLRLPSQEALLARCQLLENEYPSLRDFTINSSAGMAEDRAFIESFFKYHVLLSNGREFVHDQLFHVIPTLRQMLRNHAVTASKNFINVRKTQRHKIESAYKNILHIESLIQQNKHVPEPIKTSLPKMIAGLSAVVDILTASSDPELSLGGLYFLENLMDLWLWTNPKWQNYWKKRYPDEKIDFRALRLMWQQTRTFAQQSQPDATESNENKLENLKKDWELLLKKEGGPTAKDLIEHTFKMRNLQTETESKPMETNSILSKQKDM